ncbi:Short coiled-coil protein [Collichthys lucidus]|uniref:Short coiled-coil protein n=3 Tax=Euacanthomorphacea TaxID=123369 RepID=A0A4U5UD97_COLLU|nr:Short coiled-coil protein [Collichthys lucidus]
MGTDAPLLLAAVSLLSALQMGFLAWRVGLSRIAHKVLPPSVTGPPEFERTFRAHQNCVECYPVFLVTLWSCGLFFSEVTAAVAGLVYIIARQIYANGYVKSTKKRIAALHSKKEDEYFTMSSNDGESTLSLYMAAGDMENQAELEEKTRLINQVLELQHTLEDLSARVDAVKEENLKLKSENQVLGQYIENLMSASSVFQTTDTKSKRK